MTPIKVNFRNLQILERGDYDSGYKEGYKIGYETGYSVGFSDGAQNATEEYNQTLLTLTGTTQPTAEEAITEINATLADALTGKGVEADATETTEELAGKVEQIEDWVATQTKSLDFSGVGLYDETALKHFPNLYGPNLTSIMFSNNARLETVGDIYAPNCSVGSAFFRYTNVRRIGKLTLGTVGSYAFNNNPYLEEIEELNARIVGSPVGVFKSSPKLAKIGGVIDFTGCTGMPESFGGVLSEFRVVPNSINFDFNRGTYLLYCAELSYETLVSIKNGLADRTGQTPLTLALHSEALAKYTEEDIAEILAKNWLVE